MLSKINVASELTAELIIVDETAPSVTAPETLVLTASIKPFINLVWGGTIIMALGFFASLYGRIKRFRLSQPSVSGSKDLAQNGSSNGHKNGHENGNEKIHKETHKHKSQ